MTCTATFNTTPTSQQFDLTVWKNGNGSGTVTSTPAGIDCGNDCLQSFLEGTSVQLTATAEPGSTFLGWSGDADCSDGSVNMNQDRDCIANFDISDPGSCQGVVQLENWSTFPDSVYETTVAQSGQDAYTDRNYTLTNLSEALAGGTFVQTANDDKSVQTGEHLLMTLCSEATIYVGYDKRADELPTWLSGPEWTLTNEVIESTDGAASPMPVYKRSAPSGAIMLGGNIEGGQTGADSNYVLVVRPELGVFSDGLESGDASNWTLVCDGDNPDQQCDQ